MGSRRGREEVGDSRVAGCRACCDALDADQLTNTKLRRVGPCRFQGSRWVLIQDFYWLSAAAWGLEHARVYSSKLADVSNGLECQPSSLCLFDALKPLMSEILKPAQNSRLTARGFDEKTFNQSSSHHQTFPFEKLPRPNPISRTGEIQKTPAAFIARRFTRSWCAHGVPVRSKRCL